MIVLPVLIAVGLGWAVRPARHAQLAIGVLVGLFALAAWLAAAHDDGETGTFVASVTGLWILTAAAGALGSYLAGRRSSRTR